ncbi:hypothetical protein ABKN59_004864 [Abortiporus biennis]
MHRMPALDFECQPASPSRFKIRADVYLSRSIALQHGFNRGDKAGVLLFSPWNWKGYPSLWPEPMLGNVYILRSRTTDTNLKRSIQSHSRDTAISGRGDLDSRHAED